MNVRGNRGFSLLEALVTLVIVALIVSALMQALSQTLLMRTSLIRYQRETREAALQEMWFRESLSGAIADLHDAYGPMRGGSLGLSMPTLSPLSGKGLVRTEWRLQPADGGMALVYADPQLGELEVLAGPLEEAGFQYLSPDGDWRPDWSPAPDEAALPSAVRLRARGQARDIDWIVPIVAAKRPQEFLRPEATQDAL